MKILLICLVIVFMAALWVRLAPSSVARWHSGSIDTNTPRRMSYLTHVDYARPASEVLANLDKIARSEPRTRVLAGSVAAGKITYVSRSRVFGFPDYTTVTVEGEENHSTLTMYGRLRFGYSDTGVNRQRILRWLKPLETFK